MKEDGWCSETDCIAHRTSKSLAVQYKSSTVALVLAAVLSVLTICSV